MMQQNSGYTLTAEPEPRNVVAEPGSSSVATNPPAAAEPSSTSNRVFESTVSIATTGDAPASIQHSDSPAHIESTGSRGGGETDEQGEEAPQWGWADRSQTLRAYQRDELHVSKLHELFSDVVRSIVGSRRFLANQTKVSVLAKILYYGLTFGLGTQTLGEEYVEIYPYVNKKRNFPSRLRRLVSLALLIGAPHMVAALARLLTKGLQSDQDDDDDDDHEQADASPRQRTRRRVLLNVLNSVWVRALPEIWFAWFLIKGRNVEWTKSLMGMSYASQTFFTITNSPTVAQKPASAYEPIGFLLLLPVLNRILTSWRDQRTRNRQAMTEQGRPAGKPDSIVSSAAATAATEHLPSSSFYIDGHPLAHSHIHPELYTGLEETQPNVPPPQDLDPDAAQTQDDHPPRQLAHSILPVSQLANPDRQCPLCLAPCGLAPEAGGTCVTECGHVFCWSCIEDWAAEKMECPLCRQALRLERLTPLYNL